MIYQYFQLFLDTARDSTRERQESRGSVMRELENRRRRGKKDWNVTECATLS